MRLNDSQALITVVALMLGTMTTRFLPFLAFPKDKNVPAFAAYLGRVLPAATMGLLAVYSLRGISLARPPHGIPEIIATAAVLLLHRWKGNTLLSIGAGTVLYMFLVQIVF